MEEKIRYARETAARFNEVLAELGYPYKLDVVDPRKIKLLDKNARYMDQPTFAQLVSNIRKDKGLASLPFCWREADGTDIVLSGNQRVQSAVQAELSFILILYTDAELTRDEQIAIQLSHNSLAGKDDMVILKDLWSELQKIEFKMYAGLDSTTIGALEKLEFTTLSDPAVRTEQLIFQFLPEEREELSKVMNKMNEHFSLDNNYLLSLEHYDDVFAVIVETKEKYGIVNNPTAIMKICELAKERLADIPMPEKK
jgi:hypothetical protein